MTIAMQIHHEPRILPFKSSFTPSTLRSMFARIREAIEPFPKAMLFELRDRGFGSLFEMLVACVISVRTYDEVSLEVSLRLFDRARTPRQLAKLNEAEIAGLIEGSTFARQKARSLLAIAEAGLMPGGLSCRYEDLVALPGIGPKCASLALGLACDVPAIGVDVHVHRIVNRWGFVAAPTPEKTRLVLLERLPRQHWLEINELLVPFGKHICTGARPKCSTCPVLENCRRIGVRSSR